MSRRKLPEELTHEIHLVATTVVPDKDTLNAHGHCASPNVDPDWWFPPTEGQPDWDRTARAICEGCPVRLPCLAYAVNNPKVRDVPGIWGGRDDRERETIYNSVRYRRRVELAGGVPWIPSAPSGSH